MTIDPLLLTSAIALNWPQGADLIRPLIAQRRRL
jgi:hypothetical protein